MGKQPASKRLVTSVQGVPVNFTCRKSKRKSVLAELQRIRKGNHTQEVVAEKVKEIDEH